MSLTIHVHVCVMSLCAISLCDVILFLLLPPAPDGFDAVSAVSVQNVGSTYIIVSWNLPIHMASSSTLVCILPPGTKTFNTKGVIV